jgi:hypothetical protein
MSEKIGASLTEDRTNKLCLALKANKLEFGDEQWH